MLRALGLGTILLAFWLVLSGHYEPRLISLGVVSVTVAVVLGLRMKIIDDEGVPFRMGGRFCIYLVWLLKEVFTSNLRVARIILDPKLPINPVLVRYRASQATDVGRVLYANSITLTPGTITTHVEGSELDVHALTWIDVDGREEDRTDRWVTWVERGGKR